MCLLELAANGSLVPERRAMMLTITLNSGSYANVYKNYFVGNRFMKAENSVQARMHALIMLPIRQFPKRACLSISWCERA
jgi:hypothetical protein